jgi:hypothetical protein
MTRVGGEAKTTCSEVGTSSSKEETDGESHVTQSPPRLLPK